jgi:hypothetical protein
MFDLIGSISAVVHVVEYSGVLMFSTVVLAKALGLGSLRITDWFWEIVGCCFIFLMYEYGQPWCMNAYHGYPLANFRLTDGETWAHLVVAFWSGLGGAAVGLIGWRFVADKNRSI